MTITFSFQDLNQAAFINKALQYAQTKSHFAYYQSNGIEYPYEGFNHVLAIGASEILIPGTNSFAGLKHFHDSEWCFGYLGYDLKNELEALKSENIDHVGFKEIQFFKAKTILFISDAGFKIEGIDILDEIVNTKLESGTCKLSEPEASVSKDNYTQIVERLRRHIKEGDCYEINYCQEFHGEFEVIDPLSMYQALNLVSPKPFSCFQKFNEHFIISASPERFIKKEGNKIISQPIKGTRPRGTSVNEDIRLKTELRNDEKELAENMMIVDLVRNDLSKIAIPGSVQVEEIFDIYSFQQVHQMISTISAEQASDKHFVDVIKEAFPMGSMTGAPKIKVMELIEIYENTKRGAFSGAAGYITPVGDFDFNVLIRSLFLNTESNKYSFQVGSAITYDSIPDQEYDECLVKASAIFQLLDKMKASKV